MNRSRKRAREGSKRSPMRPKGPSGNKVGHRLSLEKVHAIIQERPLGKLPRVRLPSPDIKAALKQSGEHYRTTMALSSTTSSPVKE